MPPKSSKGDGWQTPQSGGNKKKNNNNNTNSNAASSNTSKSTSRARSPSATGSVASSSAGMQTPPSAFRSSAGGGWSSNSSNCGGSSTRSHQHQHQNGGGGGKHHHHHHHHHQQIQHQHQFQLLPSLSSAVGVVSSQKYVEMALQSAVAYAGVCHGDEKKTTNAANAHKDTDNTKQSKEHNAEEEDVASSSSSSPLLAAILALPSSISQEHHNPTQHTSGPAVTAFTRQEITTMRHELDLLIHDVTMSSAESSGGGGGGGGGKSLFPPSSSSSSAAAAVPTAKDNLCASTLAEWLGYRAPMLDSALAEAVRDLNNSSNKDQNAKNNNKSTNSVSLAAIPLQFRFPFIKFIATDALPTLLAEISDAVPQLLASTDPIIPIASSSSPAAGGGGGGYHHDSGSGGGGGGLVLPTKYQSAVTNCYAIACILRLVSGFLFVWGALAKQQGKESSDGGGGINGRATAGGVDAKTNENKIRFALPSASSSSEGGKDASSSASQQQQQRCIPLEKALGPQLSRHFAFATRQKKFSQEAVYTAMRDDVDPFVVHSTIGSLMARCVKLTSVGLECSAVPMDELKTSATFPEDVEAAASLVHLMLPKTTLATSASAAHDTTPLLDLLGAEKEHIVSALRNRMRLHLAVRMVRHSALLCLYSMATAAPNAVFNHWASLFPTTVPTHFNHKISAELSVNSNPIATTGAKTGAGECANTATSTTASTSAVASTSASVSVPPLAQPLIYRRALQTMLSNREHLRCFLKGIPVQSTAAAASANIRTMMAASLLNNSSAHRGGGGSVTLTTRNPASALITTTTPTIIGSASAAQKHPLFTPMHYDPSLSNRCLAATLITTLFQQSHARLAIAMEPAGQYGLGVLRYHLAASMMAAATAAMNNDNNSPSEGIDSSPTAISSPSSPLSLLSSSTLKALSPPVASYTSISTLMGHVVYSTHIAFRQAILDGGEGGGEEGGEGEEEDGAGNQSQNVEAALSLSPSLPRRRGPLVIPPPVETLRSAWRSLLFHHLGTIVSLSTYQHCPRSAEVLGSFFFASSSAMASISSSSSSSPGGFAKPSLRRVAAKELSGLHGILVKAMRPVLSVTTATSSTAVAEGDVATTTPSTASKMVQRESNGDDFDSSSSTSSQFFAPAERVSAVRLLHTLWKVKGLGGGGGGSSAAPPTAIPTTSSTSTSSSHQQQQQGGGGGGSSILPYSLPAAIPPLISGNAWMRRDNEAAKRIIKALLCTEKGEGGGDRPHHHHQNSSSTAHSSSSPSSSSSSSPSSPLCATLTPCSARAMAAAARLFPWTWTIHFREMLLTIQRLMWATATVHHAAVPDKGRFSGNGGGGDRFGGLVGGTKKEDHRTAAATTSTTNTNSTTVSPPPPLKEAALEGLPPAMQRLSPDDLLLTAVEAFKGLITYFGFEWAGVGLHSASLASATAATAKPSMYLSSSSTPAAGANSDNNINAIQTTVAGLLTAGATTTLTGPEHVKRIKELLATMGVIPSDPHTQQQSSSSNTATSSSSKHTPKLASIPLPFTASPLIGGGGGGDLDLVASLCEEGSLSIRKHQEERWEKKMGAMVMELLYAQEERRRRREEEARRSADGGCCSSSVTSDDGGRGRGGSSFSHDSSSSSATSSSPSSPVVFSALRKSNRGSGSRVRASSSSSNASSNASEECGSSISSCTAASSVGGGDETKQSPTTAANHHSHSSRHADPNTISLYHHHHHTTNNDNVTSQWSAIMGFSLVPPDGGVGTTNASGPTPLSSSAFGNADAVVAPTPVAPSRRVVACDVSTSNSSHNGDGSVIATSSSSSSSGGGGGNTMMMMSSGRGKRPSIASLLLNHKDFAIDDLLSLLHDEDEEKERAMLTTMAGQNQQSTTARSTSCHGRGSRSHSSSGGVAKNANGGEGVGVIGKSVKFASPTTSSSPSAAAVTSSSREAQGVDSSTIGTAPTTVPPPPPTTTTPTPAAALSSSIISEQAKRRDKRFKQFQRYMWLQQAKLLALEKIAVPLLLLSTSATANVWLPSILGGTTASHLTIKFSPLLIALAIRFVAQVSEAILFNESLVSAVKREAILSVVMEALPPTAAEAKRIQHQHYSNQALLQSSSSSSASVPLNYLLPLEPCIRIEALSALATWAVTYPRLRPMLTVEKVTSAAAATTVTTKASNTSSNSSSLPQNFFSECAARIALAAFNDNSILIRSKACQALAVVAEVAMRHRLAVEKLKGAYDHLATRNGYAMQFETSTTATNNANGQRKDAVTAITANSLPNDDADHDGDNYTHSDSNSPVVDKATRRARREAALSAANAILANTAMYGSSGCEDDDGDGRGLLSPTDTDANKKHSREKPPAGAVKVVSAFPIPPSSSDVPDSSPSSFSSSSSCESVMVAKAVADTLWREAFSVTGAVAAGIPNQSISSLGPNAAAASLVDLTTVQLCDVAEEAKSDAAKQRRVIPILNARRGLASLGKEDADGSQTDEDDAEDEDSRVVTEWYAIQFAAPLLSRADLQTIADAATYTFDCPKASHLPRNVFSAAALAVATNRDAIVARLLRDGVFGNPANVGNKHNNGNGNDAVGDINNNNNQTTDAVGRYGAYRTAKMPEESAPLLPSINGGGGDEKGSASSATAASTTTKGVPSTVILPIHVCAGLEAVFTPSTLPQALRTLTFAALLLPSDDHYMFMTDYSSAFSFVNAVVSAAGNGGNNNNSAASVGGKWGGGGALNVRNANNSNGVSDPLFSGPLFAAAGAAPLLSAATGAGGGGGGGAGGPYATLPCHQRIGGNNSSTTTNACSASLMQTELAEAHEEGLAALLLTMLHIAMTRCRDAKDRAAAASIAGSLLLSPIGRGSSSTSNSKGAASSSLSPSPSSSVPAASTATTTSLSSLSTSSGELACSDPQRLITLLRDLVGLALADGVYLVRAKAASALGGISPFIQSLVDGIGEAEEAKKNGSGGGANNNFSGSNQNSKPSFDDVPVGFNPFASSGKVQRSPILGPNAAPTGGPSVSDAALPSSSATTTTFDSTDPQKEQPIPTTPILFNALCTALQACDNTQTFSQFRDVDLLRVQLSSSIRAFVKKAPSSTAFQQAVFQHYALLEREGLV